MSVTSPSSGLGSASSRPTEASTVDTLSEGFLRQQQRSAAGRKASVGPALPHAQPPARRSGGAALPVRLHTRGTWRARGLPAQQQHAWQAASSAPPAPTRRPWVACSGCPGRCGPLQDGGQGTAGGGGISGRQICDRLSPAAGPPRPAPAPARTWVDVGVVDGGHKLDLGRLKWVAASRAMGGAAGVSACGRLATAGAARQPRGWAAAAEGGHAPCREGGHAPCRDVH